MAVVCGIHPVRELLRAMRPLERVLIAKGAGSERLQEIVDLCRAQKVPVRFESRDTLDRAAVGAVHQGVVAYGVAQAYADFNTIAAAARLMVVLDGVEDPHNLGAIVRTAHAAGADAVVIPERRAVGLTETAAKAAAGALAYLPVVRVTNITKSLEALKAKGYWIYGLDERGKEDYDEVDFADKAVIVLGGEGHGLHDLVAKHCDVLLRIPMAGAIASLNVSVAAGVMLFEWRKRAAKKAAGAGPGARGSKA